MEDERCPLGEHGAICANYENLKEQVTRNCMAVKGKVPWIMFAPVLTILVLIVGSLAGMHLSTQRSVHEIDKNLAIISNEMQHLKEYIKKFTSEREPTPSNFDDFWFYDHGDNRFLPLPRTDLPYDISELHSARFSPFTYNRP